MPTWVAQNNSWPQSGIQGILSYLRFMRDIFGRADKKHRAYWSYILRHGRAFVETIPCKGLVMRGKAKECYLNAQRAAIGAPQGVHYYEGWGYRQGLFPVEHAWLVYRGKVIDPTWERMSGSVVYFGLHIPHDYVAQQWVKTRVADALLGRYLIEEKEVLVRR